MKQENNDTIADFLFKVKAESEITVEMGCAHFCIFILYTNQCTILLYFKWLETIKSKECVMIRILHML